ncbi:MAG TPA: serine hydrolase domain-containing protein [Longimicrobium sp.]|jgi:CubicO group peptidase (beta-lactamase class C family)|uniref:serine hydrolase domain-containing protein n=1 Tax=Longimicrobium sp. TaxID=2029185 RepID=UPI002EDA6DDE
MHLPVMLGLAAILNAAPTDPTDPPGAARRLPEHALSSAAEAGLSSTALTRAEEAVWDEINRGSFPGASLAVGRWGHVVLEQGMGRVGAGGAEVDPDRTVYDLASLSKVVGTTTAVMLLVEDGRMSLDDPVQAYLPEFTGYNKDRVTIRHLLAHTSGLPAGSDASGSTPEESLLRLMRVPLESSPGMRVEYSDVGFIILFAAAERAAGEPLYRLLDRRVFEPLGMLSTTYVMGEGCLRCAGTSRTRGDAYRGKVHDPISRRLGGLSGNAGLFSTAHDLARFARMMANGGQLDGVQIFRSSTVRTFTQRQPGSGTRALGWDTPGAPGTGASGTRVSDRSFGHTGFTGTSIWIDPERGTWVVLLANRTYEEGPNRMQALRRTLHDRVADAVRGDGGYAAGSQ